MYALYEQGATLEEVGICFDITRERVRQIFKAAGLPTRPRGEVSTMKVYSDEELLRCLREAASALSGALTSGDYNQLAHSQRFADGRPWPIHQTHRNRFGSWAKALEAAGVQRRARKELAKRYSDAELLDCLRHADSMLGRALTQSAYDEFARGQRLADGRPWPTHQTHMKRFGSWRSALQGASLALAAKPSGGSTRTFTDEDCVEAIHTLARELGRPPTVAEYDRLARRSGGRLPSLPTVRNRYGTWTRALGAVRDQTLSARAAASI
jgi:hypothetical protein